MNNSVQQGMARKIALIAVLSVGCAAFLVFEDLAEIVYADVQVFDHATFRHAAAAAALTLLVSMMWVFWRLYTDATNELIRRRQAEGALQRLNLELEQRITQRTNQLQNELAARNLAEQQLLENQRQLRALSAEMSIVTERERHRVAAELHDNLGHTLAVVSNQLGMLRMSCPCEADKARMDNIRALVKESINYSRNLIGQLNSPFFSGVSFPSAVEWMANDILQAGNIEVSMTLSDPPERMGEDVRLILYKALEETLVNVVKHAAARNVEINVRSAPDDVTIEVKDDGIGFDTATVSRHSAAGRSGLGLFILKERLALLSGTYAIASAPGRGTHVTLSVPVAARA
jgi:signal transduction histidine kinase